MAAGEGTMQRVHHPAAPPAGAGSPPAGAEFPPSSAPLIIARFGTGEGLADILARTHLSISVRVIGDEWWLIWHVGRHVAVAPYRSADSAREAYRAAADYLGSTAPASPPCAARNSAVVSR